jgi:hypothetical protein
VVDIVLRLMVNMMCVCLSANLLILCIANVRGTVNVELEDVWTEVVGHSVPDVLVLEFA